MDVNQKQRKLSVRALLRPRRNLRLRVVPEDRAANVRHRRQIAVLRRQSNLQVEALREHRNARVPLHPVQIQEREQAISDLRNLLATDQPIAVGHKRTVVQVLHVGVATVGIRVRILAGSQMLEDRQIQEELDPIAVRVRKTVVAQR